MSAHPGIGERRIDEWLEALASGAATPGGGAFAALSAAAGASLIAMVARLTLGRERYADVEERMRQIADECDRERGDLLRLADDDAEAFEAVMAAYKLPKDEEDERQARLRALQAALEQAAEVPLTVARRAVYLMGLAEEATATGNPNAASDGASGAAALYAAALAGLANVRINAFAFIDEVRRNELLDDCSRLRSRADSLLAEVDETFVGRVS